MALTQQQIETAGLTARHEELGAIADARQTAAGGCPPGQTCVWSPPPDPEGAQHLYATAAKWAREVANLAELWWQSQPPPPPAPLVWDPEPGGDARAEGYEAEAIAAGGGFPGPGPGPIDPGPGPGPIDPGPFPEPPSDPGPGWGLALASAVVGVVVGWFLGRRG